VGASPLWRVQDALMQSVRGGGPALLHTLLAQLPGLDHLDSQAIAALVFGHRDVKTTMIYTYVPNRGSKGGYSPIDRF
jgi:hypothetical protein